jgi:hypothetical protein
LVSAIIPVAVGFILALAWNVAGSRRAADYPANSGLAPQVSVAVEQAAAQAWARMTPVAMVGDAPWSVTSRAWPRAGSGRLRPDG